MKRLTKKELNNLLNRTITFEQGAFYADFIEEIIVGTLTEDEMTRDYLNTLQTYFYYLRKAERDEEYELAVKIMKALDIEENHFLHICKEYTKWYNTEKHQAIKSIRTELNTIYNSDVNE
jgi:hypothetical protein